MDEITSPHLTHGDDGMALDASTMVLMASVNWPLNTTSSVCSMEYGSIDSDRSKNSKP